MNSSMVAVSGLASRIWPDELKPVSQNKPLSSTGCFWLVFSHSNREANETACKIHSRMSMFHSAKIHSQPECPSIGKRLKKCAIFNSGILLSHKEEGKKPRAFSSVLECIPTLGLISSSTRGQQDEVVIYSNVDGMDRC